MDAYNQSDFSKETKWRSLILFGRNSATYKFAFAKSLLDQVEAGATVVTLDQLALPYARHIIEHLKANDKQGNASSSKFLDGCRSRLTGEISDDQLQKLTVQYGFNNVVDAFQNLPGGKIQLPFYEVNGGGKRDKQLIITDQLLSLKEEFQYQNLWGEIEARWRLVETAWENNISPNLLEISHDEVGELLFVKNDFMKRIDVTSSRDASNGYQKGQCFYCGDKISIVSGNDNLCHVDHFLPHKQKRVHHPANLNGVWNLVNACKSCNGSGEKHDRIADEKFLERLHARNEYYIKEKTFLAGTVIKQTGITPEERKSFLTKHYQIAREYDQTEPWSPTHQFPCLFHRA